MSLQSILIVDDNPDDLVIVKRVLTKGAFIEHQENLFTARDGLEALEFLSNLEENQTKFKDSFPPCLILLDINMPRMNGFEFLESYEKLKMSSKGSVILMLTSSDNETDRKKAESFNCVHGMIQKPLNKSRMQDIIQSYFV